MNRQLVEDLQASEGKVAGNNRQKQKLEQTLDEVSEEHSPVSSLILRSLLVYQPARKEAK